MNAQWLFYILPTNFGENNLNKKMNKVNVL